MINQDDINKLKADLDKDEAKKIEREAIRNRQRVIWAGVAAFAAIPTLLTISSLGLVSGELAGGLCGCSAIASFLLFIVGTKWFDSLPFNL